MIIDKFIRRAIHMIERPNNEEEKLKKLLKKFNREIEILDVGCGLGNKYKLLESMGFNNILGIEINPELVKINNENDRNVISPETFFSNSNRHMYDLILMSHFIEHFPWRELVSLMDRYLDYLETNGHILISSPVYHVNFYADIDHVKPYLPNTIRGVFGGMEQVQIYPKHRIELVDLYFRRAPFCLAYFKSLYIIGINKMPRLINVLLALVFKLSFGIIGKTSGWIGLFQKVEI